MGLDISAYQGLCLINPALAHELEDDPNSSSIYINKDFPARAADLPNPCRFSSSADSFGFRAGSYSGYSRWRELLAEFAAYHVEPGRPGYADSAWNADSGPFWELICFSDCEGAIGPSVSAKLSADFQERHTAAVAWAHARPNGDGDHFMHTYNNFARAFEMAAQGGAVSFH